MHDLKAERRVKAFKFLNSRKIEYRYIPKCTCISIKLKDAAIVNDLIWELCK